MLCKDAKFLPKLSLPGCMLSRISPRKSFEGCWNILALGLFLKFESIFCECVADYHSQGKCQECLQKVCTISSSLIWSIKNLCSETGPQYTGCPQKGIISVINIQQNILPRMTKWLRDARSTLEQEDSLLNKGLNNSFLNCITGGDTFKTPSPLRTTFALPAPCFKMFLERFLNDPPPPTIPLQASFTATPLPIHHPFPP